MASPESGDGRHPCDRKGPLARRLHPGPGPPLRSRNGVAKGRNAVKEPGAARLAADACGLSRKRRPVPLFRERPHKRRRVCGDRSTPRRRRPAAAPDKKPAPRWRGRFSADEPGFGGRRHLSAVCETGRGARLQNRSACGAALKRRARKRRAQRDARARPQPRTSDTFLRASALARRHAIVTARPRPDRGSVARACPSHRARSCGTARTRRTGNKQSDRTSPTNNSDEQFHVDQNARLSAMSNELLGSCERLPLLCLSSARTIMRYQPLE